MTKEAHIEQLKKEINYVASYRGDRLVRDLMAMQNMIYMVTNSMFPLSDFLNDYKVFYSKDMIKKKTFNSAVNDLYLMALQLEVYLMEEGVYE